MALIMGLIELLL